MDNKDLLRQLPGVDRLLRHGQSLDLIGRFGRDLTLAALREVLQSTRDRILAGEAVVPMDAVLLQQAAELLEAWTAPTLRRVINATGVIIHTNLGRAPLSNEALQALQAAAVGYSTLEFDLETGERGSRSVHAEALLRRLTGAEAAFVVNNNAAATILTLSALAGPDHLQPRGWGVLISRGQLVEIGGGYRMPDVMRQSGAQMVEVGTTNRTHLRDYEAAIDANTALIMRVHHSNYAIIGFTTEPTFDDLARLAHQRGLLIVDDIGSGALLDTTQFGLAPEPMVQDSLAAGADVVMFSGDKLLGGPQAGVIVGRHHIIERLKRHPLARAVRPDKLCLSALTATLLHYLKGEALEKVPVWRMIAARPENLAERADRWCEHLAVYGLACHVAEGQSMVGGGSLPGETLPTRLLAIAVPSPEDAAAQLRAASPPVIVRREERHILVDPRTVLERDEEALLAALKTLRS